MKHCGALEHGKYMELFDNIVRGEMKEKQTKQKNPHKIQEVIEVLGSHEFPLLLVEKLNLKKIAALPP